ncbi:FBD-like protein [Artemisia annua]|uniref:FBD-like protein n=1 Tax=Artemisia annua TaxID=35608 RepID=A0A2U1LLL1_ARTAN|nr:FBD-like protein [Artemisia annua]
MDYSVVNSVTIGKLSCEHTERLNRKSMYIWMTESFHNINAEKTPRVIFQSDEAAPFAAFITYSLEASPILMSSKNVDRLSSMPQEVISVILSLMPTKYAVRTSILSKGWRYNWMLVTNLDFDDSHPDHGYKILSSFVDRVLGLCKTTEIGLFRLCCHQLWVQKSSVSRWIDEAVRLRVRELDIQVILLELPSSLFTCKTLSKLRIGYNSRDWDVCDWPTQVNLPCLKTLDVAVFGSPFLNAFRLIRGCPVLESLSLEITWRGDEEDYIFRIPTLKHLKLSIVKCASIINKVVLNVPNLDSFCLDGRWCSLFVMEDFPSLVSVSISFWEVRFVHLYVELLKGITGAKSVSLDMASFRKMEQPCWTEPHSLPTCISNNLTTIKYENCMGREDELQFLEYMLGNAQVLKTLTITFQSGLIEEETRLCAKLLKCPRASSPYQMHSFLKFPNLKHLEFKSGYRLNWLFIFQFLESCSELEQLFIQKRKMEQPCWTEPHSLPTCISNNLTTIKYENCMGREDELQFLEYMLGNAQVLKTLTITFQSGRIEEETRLCAKLLKCPRASRYCEIHLVGKSFCSASS